MFSQISYTMNQLTNLPELQTILTFLEQIGIKVIPTQLPDTTFLPGLDLISDAICIDCDKLLYPGDILHEAGHIAVTAALERPLIGTSAMPENWPTQGDEMAAILWSYAAAIHLNIPPELVFHPDGYKKDSEWLIENFGKEVYIGLPLLEWFGMAYGKERAAKEGVAAFPVMQFWLRE